MTRKQIISAKRRAARSADVRRYPDWVFHIREDVTRRNMEIYDKQQADTDARCLEICPGYRSLPWLDRMKIYAQARKDLGLSYFDISAGEIRTGKGEK